MLPGLHRPQAGLLLTLGALVLGLAACGSSGEDETTSTAQAAAGRYTVDEVAKLAGLKATADGNAWTSPTGCRVTAIMTTPAEISTYRTSADALVVTNGADDVGVKFDPTAGCREALLANLSRVK